MIKEEYVTYDTAKLLKQAGFPQDELSMSGFKFFHDDILKTAVLRPTQAQTMRWLGEKKNLFVGISYDPGFVRPPYYVEIQTLPEGSFIDYIDYPMAHSTYEAAAEAGIEAACKYIIEQTNK